MRPLTVRPSLAPSAAILAAALASLAHAPPCLAKDAEAADWAGRPRVIRLVVATGYDAGLSSAREVVLPGGSRESLPASGGLWVSAGAVLALGADGRTELQATVGWKDHRVGTSDDGLGYRAIPVELLVARTWPGFRASGGLSYAGGPAIRGQGLTSYQSLALRAALGLVAAAELTGLDAASGVRSAIGVRVVWQTLLAKDGVSGTDATVVGLTAGLTF